MQILQNYLTTTNKLNYITHKYIFIGGFYVLNNSL